MRTNYRNSCLNFWPFCKNIRICFCTPVEGESGEWGKSERGKHFPFEHIYINGCKASWAILDKWALQWYLENIWRNIDISILYFGFHHIAGKKVQSRGMNEGFRFRLGLKTPSLSFTTSETLSFFNFSGI